ncbi:MAG: type IV secretion system protein TraC [Chlamydiales bacterium]
MLEQLQKIGHRLTNLFGGQNFNSGSPHNSKLKESFAGHPLASILPYEAYDEEFGIFVGKNSLGFAIEVVPLAGSEELHQKEINSLFEEILEEGASIQCLLFADHRIEPFMVNWKDPKKHVGEIFHEIAEKRSEYFKESKKVSPRLFRFIFSYTIPVKDTQDTSLFHPLKMQKIKILKTFNSLSYAFGWTPKHLLEFVGGLVNFSLDTEMHRREWNEYQTLANQLSTGGILNVKEDRLEWKGDKNTPISFKSFRAMTFPGFWSFASMQHLIGDVLRDNYRLSVPFYLHYGVHCPKQSKAEQDFWTRSQLIEKQGSSNALRRMIPQLNEELNECSQVRQSTAQGARYVWTQFSVGFWGEEEEFLQSKQVLKSLFRLNQFTLAENHFLHLPHFLAALPLTWSEYVQDFKKLNLLKTTLTTECGNFVPLQGEWGGTAPNPGMLLIGRRGQLVNWNPFDNKSGNYNVAIAGRSGSGKSVFMQDLLLSGLSSGAKVFVLEVGRSFEKLCDLLNGQVIEFSKQSPICLNPFTLIPADEEERNTSFSFIKSIIACMASPNESTSSYEFSLIEEAINSAWKKRQHQATISDVAYWLLQHEDQHARKLGTTLRPYAKEGVYARYFEGENNVNFTNSMVWIELEELKEKKDLQSVVLQLLIMTITNQAFLGDRKTPFYICIDEAWDLLRGNQTGVFIETLARRLRKYYGSLVIGTQGIEDFYATPGAQAAFENSDWTCLLASKKSSISLLVENGKLHFSEYQQKAMESVTMRQGEYSEVMICDSQGGYSISRLVLDPFSQLLYTTKAKEYARLKELQNQGMTISESINYMLKYEKS